MMIGKQISGKSFGGCVRYILDKPEAKILAVEGVRIQNGTAITQDFNLQRKMNPDLGKAVGHLVLSWSKEDLPKLDDKIMAEQAKEYMKKMNIRNTQYVVVRHSDREHPHLHIIYNRVANNGKTISDRNNFKLNIKACKEMTLRYGYHLGKGKEQVNRLALKGTEKLRYELYDAIKAAVKESHNWKELEANLQKQGINIQYKLRSGTSEVQGISFKKGEFKMKGSAIDRTFNYFQLNARLSRNHEAQQQHIAVASNKPSLADQIKEAIKEQHHGHESEKSVLEILLSPEFGGTEPDPVGDAEKRRRKRKKHENEQSQGLSR